MQKILVQSGIPRYYFDRLQKQSIQLVEFPNDAAKARLVFTKHANTEALLIRANFQITRNELDCLPHLKRVGLVSTGSDLIDTPLLNERSIQLTTGEGANARAVFDYVIHALFEFWQNIPQTLHQGVGIIGKGRIGSLLCEYFSRCGIPHAAFDPFVLPMANLSETLNFPIVSFHVPLSTGQWGTRQMLNANYFDVQKKFPLHIINTSRGQIFDPQFYRSLRQNSRIKLWAQDVFPEEPPLNSAIHQSVFSTPHIAGYSTQGRLGGLRRCLKTFFPEIDFSDSPLSAPWSLRYESMQLKIRGSFNARRDTYPWRKEFQEYTKIEKAWFRQIYRKIPQNFVDNLFR